MEMQNPNFHGTLEILKSAAKIPLNSRSFIIFAIFTSLPLFSATLGDELFFEKEPVTFKGIFNLVLQLYHFFASQLLLQMVAIKIIKTNLLYILFFDLMNLLVAATIVSSASEIYGNGGKSTALKNLLPKSMRFRGILSTVIYKSVWSFIFSIAVFCWIAAGPTIIEKDLFSKVMWFIILSMASAKWLEYTLKWNISIVVSVLEDIKSGFVSRSEDLIKGNKLRGSLLMFIYFVWWGSSIVSTQNVNGSFVERLGCALVQSSLLCVGKVMLWLVCVVYYFDCRKRLGEVFI